MPKLIDLTGKRIGKLTVIKRFENYATIDSADSRVQWLVKCDCGNVFNVIARYLYRTKNPCKKCREPSRNNLHGLKKYWKEKRKLEGK